MTTAVAHPNIALVKYWGKRDVGLNLPATSSLSLTLREYQTETTITWDASADQVLLNGQQAPAAFASRVLRFLDLAKPGRTAAHVVTTNNFPAGAGLASSASGFAALAMAAAPGLPPEQLSVLARQGSGSACRSIFGGFVRWDQGTRTDGLDSFARPLPPSTWQVAMVAAVVSDAKKAVGSTEGMERSRATSPLYEAWTATSAADCDEAERAISTQDLERLGTVMERSTFAMHGTMHSSTPPLIYWQPATVALLAEVQQLRSEGIGAWATMDAGPQVKVLCMHSDAPTIASRLAPLCLRADVLTPGPAARCV